MEYSHYDDYHQRIYEFSLLNMADGAIAETAISTAPADSVLSSQFSVPGSTTQTPGLKSAPHKTNLDIDYAIDKKIVTITLNHSAASLENCTVSTTLLRYYDMHENYGNPVTWTFRVKQNPLLWETDKKDVSVPVGQGGTFTVKLTNYGKDEQTWQFPELPSWLTASQTSGTLQPNQSVDITFTASSANAIGRYFATISARTEVHQSPLDTPLDICVTVEGVRPNGTAGNYPEHMGVIGQICIDGITSTDTEDLVGAFIYDNGEMKCVGKGQPAYDSQRDAYYVTMIVKGEKSMAGSLVSFRIYDASSGKTYPLISTTPAVHFQVDGFAGETSAPVIWKNEEKLLQTEFLSEGWTSISLYVKPDTDDQHLFDILGDNIVELDVDKNTALTHSDGVWSASYSPILPGQMMKVRLTAADTLYVVGNEVNPADYKQTIAPNGSSTWIGVPTQAVLPIGEAFAGIEPEENDIVWDDDDVSVFYGNTWNGGVTDILPGRGYVYTSQAATEKELVFPATSASGLTTYHAARHGLPASRKYAHGMVAICALRGENQELMKDAVVEVYDRMGELRGRSHTLLGGRLRVLFISGDIEGEPLMLIAKLPDGAVTARKLSFHRYGRLGTVKAPYLLDTVATDITPLSTLNSQLSTVNCQLSTISVYTTSGLLVYNGPAADYTRKHQHADEPLIIIGTADDGQQRVYKLR